MNRETELTKKIEEAGWEIIGVGFKENNSDAMKVTDAQKNKRRGNERNNTLVQLGVVRMRVR